MQVLLDKHTMKIPDIKSIPMKCNESLHYMGSYNADQSWQEWLLKSDHFWNIVFTLSQVNYAPCGTVGRTLDINPRKQKP